MPRAVHPPKTREDLLKMSLEELNAEIRNLKVMEGRAGTGVVRKLYRKNREVLERVREKQFGVLAKGKSP